VGDPDIQWQIDYGIGLALDQSGDTDAAINALLTAVKIIEATRNRLRERRYRSGYLQNKHQVYIELVRMQMKLSRTDDAFETAERLRTWTFAAQSEMIDAGFTLTEDQARYRTELRERIRQLQRNLDEERTLEVPEQRQLAIETYSAELLLAERDFQALIDDLAGQQDGFRTLQPGFDRKALQAQLRPNEAMVEYLIGATTVTIFVLTREGLHGIDSPAGQKNLHSRLELLRNLLDQRDNDRWQVPAQSLAGILLSPVLDRGLLTGIDHLYLVPHGVLNYLPFALLPTQNADQQQPLIARYTLAYLPSATSLALATRDYQQSPTLLAMAPEVSRLAHAPEEVRSIGALYSPNAEVLIGVQATESKFKRQAGKFQVLHLATHGYFNKDNPMLSGLQLEADKFNDGLLEVHEILELRLNSDLVTLSACRTGLGSGYFSDIPAGDDFVGMTRAFLQVGSASVLATLWEVEDRSTVDFMKSFYGHLDTSMPGHDKAAALANAQRALIASQNHTHPYYWAPFILVGSMSQNREAQG
jgi:CHAT domain-containing protein